jgi:hypothetical protein
LIGGQGGTRFGAKRLVLRMESLAPATGAGAALPPSGVTLSHVPTRKPRYMLTDTGDLSELLDAAQRRWPEVTDRKALLLRLAASGGDAIAAEEAKRRAVIEETAGALTGLYEPGELERLREDWPQ